MRVSFEEQKLRGGTFGFFGLVITFNGVVLTGASWESERVLYHQSSSLPCSVFLSFGPFVFLTLNEKIRVHNDNTC
ncbi:hypothetical protein B0J18DRAFT_158397 [Chaetomium sp. MPI-SDFR-AT-0129]|nr:hypothetical protein B0J18DRAFT_158397 [Chaetomium sp. MPI-SDFR-AT-0129]